MIALALMKILMVTSEWAPLAKTGGLADAVAGLGNALATRGHDVRVLLPRYSPSMLAGPEPAESLSDTSRRFRFFPLPHEEGAPRVYLLDLPSFGADPIYWGDERDAVRFLYFCVAALRFPDATAWRPDAVHCHDWQTALVPALRDRDDGIPAVLTLHNVGHQGAYGLSAFENNDYANVAPLVDPKARKKRAVNYLRAGILAADAVTTVSPTYATEIQTSRHGMGLEKLLAARRDLCGILNGVDYSVWSPGNDPFLSERFCANDTRAKRTLKRALGERLGLESDGPLVCVVSRLEKQKGIDVIVSALPALLRRTRANVAIHGRGRDEFARKIRALQRKWPGRVAFADGYEEALAHNILAASDILLMASRYEPCGLVPMYGMRYGTIPVVPATGGLVDTVRHFDPRSGVGTGCVFPHAGVRALLAGVKRALEWFEDPAVWPRLMQNAMHADFSWAKQVEAYEAVYADAVEKACRRRAAVS